MNEAIHVNDVIEDLKRLLNLNQDLINQSEEIVITLHPNISVRVTYNTIPIKKAEFK